MTRPIVGYCRDASAVPGFQIVETAQRDVSTRNIRGWGSGLGTPKDILESVQLST